MAIRQMLGDVMPAEAENLLADIGEGRDVALPGAGTVGAVDKGYGADEIRKGSDLISLYPKQAKAFGVDPNKFYQANKRQFAGGGFSISGFSIGTTFAS